VTPCATGAMVPGVVEGPQAAPGRPGPPFRTAARLSWPTPHPSRRTQGRSVPRGASVADPPSIAGSAAVPRPARRGRGRPTRASHRERAAPGHPGRPRRGRDGSRRQRAGRSVRPSARATATRLAARRRRR
jgi:hypothetical protein